MKRRLEKSFKGFRAVISVLLILSLVAGVLPPIMPSGRAQAAVGAKGPSTTKKESTSTPGSRPTPNIPKELSQAKKAAIAKKAASVGMPFIPNEGQIKHKNVKFYANIFAGALFVTDDGELTYALPAPEKKRTETTETNSSIQERAFLKEKANKEPKAQKGWALKERLIGAQRAAPKGIDKAVTTVNYFKGNDKSKWKTNISTYNGVTLGEVYEGVRLDLRVRGNNVEKIFTVSPGANPKKIKLSIKGARSLSVNKSGELEVATGIGAVRFTAPIAYQEEDGRKEYVGVSYQVDGDTYGFVVGDYDKSRPLIIDPLLASTYIGGGSDETLEGIVTDSAGNIYVAGWTTSTNYPVMSGPYGVRGYVDIFVSRLSSDLKDLLASTVIGGSSRDYANSIAIDSAGNIFVAGLTYSVDLPMAGTPYNGSHSNDGGERDIIIFKLNPNLNSLLASTYIGGNEGDGAESIAIDGASNVIVGGWSISSDYPTTGTPYSASNEYGDEDAIISKLDSNLSNLLASTYIGGSGWEEIYSLAIDSTGDILVTGATSGDYPVTTGKTYSGGYTDIFVSKLDPNLSTLKASTYIGGNSYDYGNAIAVDSSNNALIAGITYSSNYPVTTGKTLSGYADIIVSKLSPDLSALLASTLIGGSSGESASSMAIGSSGDIYVAGGTSSFDYPVTAGAYYGAGSDAVISKLSSSLSTLQASTVIGGSSHDYANSIAIDGSGNIFVAGDTKSSDYPVTTGKANSGGYDGFISKFTGDLFVSKAISGLRATDEIAKLSIEEVDTASYIGDPIDASTGAHVLERTLLTLNGAEPLQFTLRYNSLLLAEGPLGKGWEHNFETRLEALANGDVDIHWSANRKNRFINDGADHFTAQDLANRFDTLVKNADGSYTFTKQDQRVYKFAADGKLIEQKNGHGQSFVFTYDASGRLSKVKEPVSAKEITFTYNAAGRISTVTDSAGRQVSFAYDTTARTLTDITDAKGQATTYTYNSLGQVLSAMDPDGVVVFRNTYDAAGRVATQDDAIATNELTRLSYDETSTPGKLITTVTDRNGSTRVLTHDSTYKLLSIQDELGNTIATYTYDADGNRVSAKDADNHTAFFAYDARGNMLVSTDTAGNATKMTYDARNNLLSVEDPLGKKTIYTYDTNNNPTSVTDALGKVTTFTYDSNGLLLTKTAPRGGKVTYTYQNGLPKTIT
ncbi:MAG: SBBP repeat-containing protein, partial [Actinobacteria bacterium]|nr:SBBP repeat-containing protein [Actinomycetota bacterium]